MRALRTPLLSVWLIVGAAACASGPGNRVCNVNADCASGVCRADGTCAPVGGADASAHEADASLDAGVLDAAEILDATSIDSGATPIDDAGGGPHDAGPPRDAGGFCAPNHDGRIDRDEVSLAAGVTVRFRIATHADVSTIGTHAMDGLPLWDLSGALSGDHDVDTQTTSLTGAWFASSFSGATYSTKLSDSSDLLGVFEITASSLLLRGIVSPTDGLYRTLLTYSPAVETLRFPIVVGDTWTSTNVPSGTYNGLVATWSERYDVAVGPSGHLMTPFGTFPVLRVGVVQTKTVGVLVTTVRQFMFVSECYGIVAVIVSEDNETASEFTRAAEVRRITP